MYTRRPLTVAAGGQPVTPLFNDDVAVSSSHANTLSWCCTSFVNLRNPSACVRIQASLYFDWGPVVPHPKPDLTLNHD